MQGDLVTVANHGNLFQFATVCSVNTVNNTARIKWDMSRKIDTVDISDLQCHSLDEVTTRKRKVTDFLVHNCDAVTYSEKSKKISKTSESKKITYQEMKFFSQDNNCKLCTEGAIKNLLYEMNFLEKDIESFWSLATSPLNVILDVLNDAIPKAVCNSYQQHNAIEKCCWILRKMFKFTTTRKLKLSYFTSVEQCLEIFNVLKFPVVIAVHSRGAIYDHVVVIWNSKVFDYESKYVDALSPHVLQQMCGENTAFRCISTGYGLFPPSACKAMCPHILDWGEKEYHDKQSKIRKYFTHK